MIQNISSLIHEVNIAYDTKYSSLIHEVNVAYDTKHSSLYMK